MTQEKFSEIINFKSANLSNIENGKTCPDFVTLCSIHSIPILTLVDTEGVATSEKAEQKDISSKLARLASAYAGGLDGTLKITVVLGRAYGTAYTVSEGGLVESAEGEVAFISRYIINAISPDIFL